VTTSKATTTFSIDVVETDRISLVTSSSGSTGTPTIMRGKLKITR
jgi:phenylacetate-coenzyme A ligase PaaK-like adenylate-forming protein